MAAECLGRLDRLDIEGERQFAPRRQHRVAQDLADLLVVPLVFVGVVARRLEIEDAAVVFEDVREFRRETRSRETRAPAADSVRGGALDQRLRRRVGALPGRRAAYPDARRRHGAVDVAARRVEDRGAQRRDVLDACGR